jgi:RNA polymerase sigma-70 factor, ECF subfamily
MNREEASRSVTALFKSWYSSLVRYALRTTGSYELAEDLVQEAFMQLYRALRAGKTIVYPKAWTLCVLRRSMSRETQNLTLDRALHEPFEETELAGKAVATEFEVDEIRGFLSVLTPREEEVLLLRLESLKYREIADQLGISMNSVNTLLARALRKLQKATARKHSERSTESHGDQNASKALRR